jgi:phosphatidylglycerophosphate synthase
MPDLPDRDAYFDLWSGLHGGYDPRGAYWPRTWLTLTYRCAVPLARLGVAPDAITLAGGLISAMVAGLAALGGRWPLPGVVVVVGSGLVDNLDGAVAALTGRATAFGYVLDSLVDRLSDGCYLLALWLLGAPAWLCVLGGVVTMLQEYLRARAGNAGLAGLGVVTVAERPTRVIVTAFALCGAGVLPGHAAPAGTLAAAAWLVTGAVGFCQLALATHRRLSGD